MNKAQMKLIQDRNESTLYTICLGIGIFFIFLLVITCFGAIYASFFMLYFYIFHIFLMSSIRGNGVMVSEYQYPHINSMVERITNKLGLQKKPEVYVIQAGGALNAMATKLFGRNFVVIYADLLEACESDKEVEMIVGHEIAHLTLGHLSWKQYLVLPSVVVPFLYQAYSRAREQSCDNIGLYACGDLDAARRALLILAAGKKMAPQVNMDGYRHQAQYLNSQTSMTIMKFFMYYPYLYQRVLELDRVQVIIGSTEFQSATS